MTSPNSILVQAAHGPSTPALSDLGLFQLTQDQSPQPQWWLVEVSAQETWIDNSSAGELCPTASDISNFPPRSALIGRLAWANEGSRNLFFDIGAGLRLCVWANRVEFSVCGPSGSNGLRQAIPGKPLVRGSEVSLTSVMGQAEPLTYCREDGAPPLLASALGLRQGRLTLRQRVAAAGAAPTIELPPGVTDLQLFEYSAAGPSPANVPWLFLDRLGTPIARVPLANGLSERVAVPGFAHSIQLSAIPLATTLYTLSFSLDW